MSKITKIPSEIRTILNKKRCYSVMGSLSRLLESFHLDSRCLGGNKRENGQLTNLQLFQILVLMPFFAIKGFSHYLASALSRMLDGKKDVLFSFMSHRILSTGAI